MHACTYKRRVYYKIGLQGFWRAKNEIWIRSAKYLHWNVAQIDVFRVSIPRPLYLQRG